jgi:hypothetical protein
MDGEHEVTVEYALTRPEIFRSFLRGATSSPKYLGMILLYAAAIGLLMLMLQAAVSHSVTLKDATIAAAGAIGYLVFIPIWVALRGKTATRTLTVSPDGISTEIGRLRGHVPWDKVRVVTDTPRFVLIARTNGNAFFIPDRAFTSLEHRSQFLTEIRASKPGVHPSPD